MPSLKQVNEIIIAIQKEIQNCKDEEKNKTLKDNLTFYLDLKELLVLENCRGKSPKESEN
jgi:hypothetical protein